MVNQEQQSRLDRFFDSNLADKKFVKYITKDDVEFKPIWEWMTTNRRGAYSAAVEFNVSKCRIEKWIRNTERDITKTHKVFEVDGVVYKHCHMCNTSKVMNTDNYHKTRNRACPDKVAYNSECKECRARKRKEKLNNK